MWGNAQQQHYAPLPQSEVELNHVGQTPLQQQQQAPLPTAHYDVAPQCCETKRDCKGTCCRTCLFGSCCGCCCGTTTFFIWSIVTVVFIGIVLHSTLDSIHTQIQQCVHPDGLISDSQHFLSTGISSLRLKCSTVPCNVSVFQSDSSDSEITINYTYRYNSKRNPVAPHQSTADIVPYALDGFHAELQVSNGTSLNAEFSHDNYDISSCERYDVVIVLPRNAAIDSLQFDVNIGIVNLDAISTNFILTNVQIGYFRAHRVSASSSMIVQSKTIGFMEFEQLFTPLVLANGNIASLHINNVTQPTIHFQANAGSFHLIAPIDHKSQFDLNTIIGKSKVTGFPEDRVEYSKGDSFPSASGIINPTSQGLPQQIFAKISNGWAEIRGSEVCDDKFCDETQKKPRSNLSSKE